MARVVGGAPVTMMLIVFDGPDSPAVLNAVI